MRLTVGNLKGGAGKSWTAIHVALGLSRSGRTLLVDCDPEQPLCVDWSEQAGDEWPHDRCIVQAFATRELIRKYKPVLDDYEHVVFDTGAKNRELLRQAMHMSDELLIPVQCTSGDIPETPKTLDLAAEVDEIHPINVSVLLTRVPTNDSGVSEADAREYFRQLDIPVMASRVRQIKAFANAKGSVPDDLLDYEWVLKELMS